MRAFSHTAPAVQNPQGDLYQDAEALADAWVSHFANIEGGTAVHPSLIAGLSQQERARIEQKGYKGPLKHLPTRQHIELALRKTKTRSAPGPDGVSRDVLLLTRTWIAIQVTALTVKSALTLQTSPVTRGAVVPTLQRQRFVIVNGEIQVHFACRLRWQAQLYILQD